MARLVSEAACVGGARRSGGRAEATAPRSPRHGGLCRGRVTNRAHELWSESARSATRGRHGWREVAVEHQRVEVGTVGPDNRPQVIVHTHERKKVGVREWFEHRPAELTAEVDVSHGSVAEADPQAVMPENLDARDLDRAHAPILGERGDRIREFAGENAVPIAFELISPEGGPLAHKAKCGRRKRALDDRSVGNPDHRVVLRVACAKVGRVVIEEIHRDDDPVDAR